MKSPTEIVDIMMRNDAFSNWLNISVDNVGIGTCELSMSVGDEMLNGFSIAHGGISYSLADSALAFASNSYGYKAVSIETSISHTRPCKLGDQLVAKAIELNRTKRIGIYSVEVKNQDNKVIGLFKGTVHISEEVW